jgi:UDP-N-acetyl-D-glucosamine dehydrogenase
MRYLASTFAKTGLMLQTELSARRLSASVDPADLRNADVAVIAVPTPIDAYRVPDLSYIKRASEELATALRPGSLIILESTTYPGTTEEILVPALEAHGMQVGNDIFVGYSPERIDPGNREWGLRNTPKVVAGITPVCRLLVEAFYGTFVDRIVSVSSVPTAEITKLFENIFRVVNIALVNEFRVICDTFGIDVWEVLEACATKPFGFMRFVPGPGLGGHCVPVDPFYLAWKAHERGVSTEFIELAGRINAAVPAYVVAMIAAALNKKCKGVRGSRVALLGVAYKKNSSDIRQAPALNLVSMLDKAGAMLTYHDPHVAEFECAGKVWRSERLTKTFLQNQDCLVMVTDHDAIDWALVQKFADAYVDTRNVLRSTRSSIRDLNSIAAGTPATTKSGLPA